MRNQQHDPSLSHDAGTHRGVQRYPDGQSHVPGRVLRGVGRYLWCRETPGQRQTHG